MFYSGELQIMIRLQGLFIASLGRRMEKDVSISCQEYFTLQILHFTASMTAELRDVNLRPLHTHTHILSAY